MMRTLPEGANFARFSLDVGDGVLNDYNNFIIPDHWVAISDSDIVDDIYGNSKREKSYGELANYAILSARNLDVEEINKRVVELFDKTTEIVYTSIDTIENCDNGDINEGLLPEYLNIRGVSKKCSDPRLYLRTRVLERPLRGMSVTSSPSRTP